MYTEHRGRFQLVNQASTTEVALPVACCSSLAGRRIIPRQPVTGEKVEGKKEV